MNYVNGIASSEGLNLQCRRDSPTATGIHNKMVLVHDGTNGWTHTGSINGSENSNKANRELAVQIKSDRGFNYLASVFNYDWVHAGGSPITVYPPGEPAALMLSTDGRTSLCRGRSPPRATSSLIQSTRATSRRSRQADTTTTQPSPARRVRRPTLSRWTISGSASPIISLSSPATLLKKDPTEERAGAARGRSHPRHARVTRRSQAARFPSATQSPQPRRFFPRLT